MRKILAIVGAALVSIAGYFGLWPVPIDPVKWDAPISEGYVGDFEPNNALSNLPTLSTRPFRGPEDITTDGTLLFASTREGKIISIDPATSLVAVVADTKGDPLGIEYGQNGELIVADAWRGLLSVKLDGTVTVLTDEAEGLPILFADDVDIAPGGMIYFTDASTRFSAKAPGADASYLEIMEHGRSGRVLSHDLVSGKTEVVHSSLSFPNGIAVTPDGQSILVAETGEYRIIQIWIEGPRRGESRVLIENLPGFPDNINRGPNNTFFIGLVNQRSSFVDENAAKPFMRKFALRVQSLFPPGEESPYGLVFQMDLNGKVLQTWDEPDSPVGKTSGALAFGDNQIFFTSPDGAAIRRLALP